MRLIAVLMVRRWERSQKFWQAVRAIAKRRDEAAAESAGKWKRRAVILIARMRGVTDGPAN